MRIDPDAVTAALPSLDISPPELAAMLAGAMRQVEQHNLVANLGGRDPLVATRARAVLRLELSVEVYGTVDGAETLAAMGMRGAGGRRQSIVVAEEPIAVAVAVTEP